jgi:hypothetical protein
MSHVYEFYLMLHRAHKESPETFTILRCQRILEPIMNVLPGTWRVVGITALALQQFAERGFIKSNDCKIQRGHLRPRNERMRELLERDHPMGEQELVEYWKHHDRTVLCAKGENKKQVPSYIPIPNDDENEFFPTLFVAWSHGPRERDCLQQLHAAADRAE